MSASRGAVWAAAGLFLCLSLAPVLAAPALAAPGAPAAPAKGAPAKGAPAKGAAAKGKKPPPRPTGGPVAAALKDKAPQIQECAVANALNKGAKKVEIHVRITINSTGAVIDSQVDINTDGGDSAQVKSCVETALRSAKFPPVKTPLATAEQTWTLAAQ
ncbi:MAG: hypothetical protein U1A78_23875 [Polyangia bacterium]